MSRLLTGVPCLDEQLGGGLLPGTLTVVVGATGIGKTQLGLMFADQGLNQESERGPIFDLSSRGDSQNHRDYAQRLCNWKLIEQSPSDRVDPTAVWDRAVARRDYLHVYRDSGRRVTVQDMSLEQRQEWEAEQLKKLDRTIAFFYGNFIHGVRRCVFDGVEPTDRASDSIQFETFEYVYQQILRKDHDWVARDLFRVGFRSNAERVADHAYNQHEIGCLLLYTSHDVMLDDLISRPLQTGGILANANTIVLMGKTREGNQMGRAMYVAKHRGSACLETIMPYRITEQGIICDG